MAEQAQDYHNQHCVDMHGLGYTYNPTTGDCDPPPPPPTHGFRSGHESGRTRASDIKGYSSARFHRRSRGGRRARRRMGRSRIRKSRSRSRMGGSACRMRRSHRRRRSPRRRR